MSSKPGPKGPHGKPRILKGTLRQKAWRAMQIKVKFSLSDLLRNAVTAESLHRDPRNNIGRYVKALTSAGVLSEMKRRLPPTLIGSNGEKRWVLIRDLGRNAPVIRNDGRIFDPNSGQIFGTTRNENDGGNHE